jgi:hypothetical protein
MIMYRVTKSHYRSEIFAIEVERETDSFVVWNGRRDKKHTEYYSWFDTEQEAREFLINFKQAHVDALEKELADAKGELARAKGVVIA